MQEIPFYYENIYVALKSCVGAVRLRILSCYYEHKNNKYK